MRGGAGGSSRDRLPRRRRCELAEMKTDDCKRGHVAIAKARPKTPASKRTIASARPRAIATCEHPVARILTTQRMAPVGRPDADIDNTNDVENVATETHAPSKIADGADTCRKLGVCASGDPQKFFGKPGRPGPAPEQRDPLYDAQRARPSAERL